MFVIVWSETASTELARLHWEKTKYDDELKQKKEEISLNKEKWMFERDMILEERKYREEKLQNDERRAKEKEKKDLIQACLASNKSVEEIKMIAQIFNS